MTVRVVCTAGHVDHGKTTLVPALTGMETARFADERRRGLTIDLGFAWTEMDGPTGPLTVAFVDLPGHERFVGNMLAGAGPIELAVLVVAANEGWKQQSQEHLDILDLLGVSRGIVALTKSDTVDAEHLVGSMADVRDRLRGTSFADVEVVPVSARTGQGLAHMRTRLAATLAATPDAEDLGQPRLWVDRSFTIRGAGTVVTGTLQGGRFHVGDNVVVSPGGHGGRIRGLQSLGLDMREATPGSRVAVNVSGIERTAIRRGDALALPGQLVSVTTLEAWVRALPGAKIGRRGAWRLHAGSGEWMAKIAPLDGDVTGPEGFIRVNVASAAPLLAGDAFVLREMGRGSTLGGGVVLDVAPPARRGRAARMERIEQLVKRLAALQAGDRLRLFHLHIVERGADDAQHAATLTGLGAEGLRDVLRQRRLLPLAHAVAAPAAAATWSNAVSDRLREYHTDHPLEVAAPKDIATRAAVAAGCPQELADALLDVLVRLGRLVVDGLGVRHRDHEIRLNEEHARARAALLDALNANLFQPPSLSSAIRTAAAERQLVKQLLDSGEIVKIAPDIAMSRSAMEAAIERLRDAYLTEGPLTASRAREVLATTRKFVIPLLEQLDAQSVTRRRGDVRYVL